MGFIKKNIQTIGIAAISLFMVVILVVFAVFAVKNKPTFGKKEEKSTTKSVTTEKPEKDETESTKKAEKETSKINARELYKKYVVDNKLKLIDSEKFNFAKNDADGIFSISIMDFDGNGIEEMLTFYYTKGESSGEEIAVDLYCIENGKVVKKRSSDSFYAAFAGNGEVNICATVENGLVKIFRDTCSFGGSSASEEFLTLRVKNNDLILCNDYMLGEFYRYDSFSYTENVSERKYNDSNEFEAEVKKAGFDKSAHHHGIYDLSKASEKSLKELKGKHIFTICYGCSFSEPDIYGFLHDNSDIKEILPLTKSPKKEKEDVKSLLLNNVWENKIQDYNEYVFKSNGTVIENQYVDPERKIEYELNGDMLTIKRESGYVTKLKYVHKDDDVDWKKDLFFYNAVFEDIGDDEGFFYEIGYEPDEYGLTNAFWLRVKTD